MKRSQAIGGGSSNRNGLFQVTDVATRGVKLMSPGRAIAIENLITHTGRTCYVEARPLTNDSGETAAAKVQIDSERMQ